MRVVLLLLLVLGACAPPACSDAEDRAMARDVQVVATLEGAPAREAEQRLAKAGTRAVAVLETGLYAAEAPGRRRIARTLAATGSKEAIPVLRHLAARDVDPDVRAAAEQGLRDLTR